MKLKNTTSDSAFSYIYLFKRIFKYLKPHMGRIILNFILATIVGMLDAVIAWSLKPYIDEVLIKKNMLLAFIIPFGIVLFAVGQGCMKYLNNYLTEWCGQKITNAVKFDLFKKLTTMSPKFYDENQTGDIIQRYLGDPQTASTGVLTETKEILTTGVGAISLIFVLLYNSWKLALVGVAILSCSVLPAALIRNRIKRTSNASIKVGGDITTNFNETCLGNKIVTSYNLQEQRNNKFIDQINETFYLSMSLIKRAGWMSPMMYLISAIGLALVMGYGTYLIISGQLSVGSMTSFVTSLLLLYKPVKSLGETFTGIQSIFVAMSRVFELFDCESDIKDKEGAIDVKELNGSVKFDHVNFEYLENQPVLKDLSIEVKKGETLALVGNSGGGKSTIANLIPRFYDIKSGNITIDGRDIRDIKLKSLRNLISVVFQDNFLFTGTIKDNIVMGNFNATDAEIQRAITGAHLDEFIGTLPEGIDTVLGERGTTLSGGQRQRVAIARAMVKDAPIVILDEATSALDNKSEKIVQKALDNLMENKTVFVIAHRLSTIQNADRIAVINEGELAELGNHNELMQIENGIYRKLYEMQFTKEDAEKIENSLV
ncbi:MAG: ABC transporter ATP-binding protein [Candidatus Gastranaerophilales bacterium]|nr:ABC transporter ATP-binding protein [Candidatus Gastranaerophilales bacterium]